MMKHVAALVAALSICAAACSKKAPEPQRTQPLEEQPAESVKSSEPVRTRVNRAPAEPPPIDPAAVPVEEDFRADAARRITKRNDLRVELDRIERDISADKK